VDRPREGQQVLGHQADLRVEQAVGPPANPSQTIISTSAVPRFFSPVSALIPALRC